jgi:hypothetical protein
MSGLLVPGKYLKPKPAEAFFDPDEERRKIMARLTDIKDYAVFGPRVLVAKWIPDKLSANLEVSTNTQTEYQWQGKTGLVLAMGHAAFKSDSQNDFGLDAVKVGDWVSFDYSDGTDMAYQPVGTFSKVQCKLLNDVQISGRVPRPDMFF